MQRREFCQGGVAIAAMALAGCQGSSQGGITVHLLQKSLPPQLIRRFRQTHGIGVNLRLKETPRALPIPSPTTTGGRLSLAWGMLGWQRPSPTGGFSPFPKAALKIGRSLPHLGAPS
ncbi:hypothetical protein [Parathermosynechococcus lividus]|uniref:hypothetical protein n=1 Tax=Parathermosynechococcus lividus TaxID=33070 RepID=UPI001D0D2118|nr:hypothetical protein [Thermostichus lividus]